MVAIRVTAKEIDDYLRTVDDVATSKYPGMTYEQGIVEALRWVLGEQDEPPSFDD